LDRALGSDVAPWVVAEFLAVELCEAVVFNLVELAGVVVQPTRRRVVAEVFAVC
jgi:hypothetical protein